MDNLHFLCREQKVNIPISKLEFVSLDVSLVMVSIYIYKYICIGLHLKKQQTEISEDNIKQGKNNSSSGAFPHSCPSFCGEPAFTTA